MTERQTRDSDRKKEIYPQLISENHICTELAFKFDILLSRLKKKDSVCRGEALHVKLIYDKRNLVLRLKTKSVPL